MSLHWVLSGNIFNESAWEEFLVTLNRFDISYSEHKVIPFIGELLPDPPADLNGGNVIVIGPYSMRHVAKEKGWYPGSFDIENKDFQVQLSHWGEHMLNADSVVCEFQHVHWTVDEPRFIRPIHDSKCFAGKMFEWDEFLDWQKKVVVLNLDYGNSLTSNTLVQVASPKQIFAEYRCWVVKGKIVTISEYKRGDRIVYHNRDRTGFLVQEYAQARVDEWQPDEAFVIDVCETPDGFKIVEINTINSCGFYACDMQKLVMALQDNF